MEQQQDPHADVAETYRASILGIDDFVPSPLQTSSSSSEGSSMRLLTYADWTATGRAVDFIESHVASFLRVAGNSHTEDAFSGRWATNALHEAETTIKKCVNAGASGRVICVGTGVTGALTKLQQILGVYLPPATRAKLAADEAAALPTKWLRKLQAQRQAKRPLVLVGPFEHHSNEVTWREGCADVVEVRLDRTTGGVDLAHLDALLTANAHRTLKIGSFSAASNVTGMVADVHAIARVLHKHGAVACFDYAASGPYVKIDMNPPHDPLGKLDAVVLSTHKFMGGPGSSGVLVFDAALYPANLPPTIGGGGTVQYVTPTSHEFVKDIEDRERSGTPGIVQTIRSSLVMDLKRVVGEHVIEEREAFLVRRALERLRAHPNVVVLGHPDPAKRLPIVAFNLLDPRGARAVERMEHFVSASSSSSLSASASSTSTSSTMSTKSDAAAFKWWQLRLSKTPPTHNQATTTTRMEDQPPTPQPPQQPIIHFRLVSALLDHLFGIQSRAGCSCAAPYGHELLGIKDSEPFRRLVLAGLNGAKPGWCRVGFHWTMSLAEADFVVDAILFLADKAWLFLPMYKFDAVSGTWAFRGAEEEHEEDGHADRRGKSTSSTLSSSLGAGTMPGQVGPRGQEETRKVCMPSGAAAALAAFDANAVAPARPQRLSLAERQALYDSYMLDANKLADELSVPDSAAASAVSGQQTCSPELCACFQQLGRHAFFAVV